MPKNRRAIASCQRKLARTSVSCLLLFAILTTTILSSSVGAQDERVTVRLDGRSVFRARARQIEGRMNRLLQNPEAIALPRIATPEQIGLSARSQSLESL